MVNNAVEAAIDIRGLRVLRGERLVLDGLDLRIRRGALTGLLGPSGCGKSTLMRAIVGVQVVAGGEVEVLGQPAGDAPLRSRVGYVTQAPSVYSDLSIRENLRYFATLLRAPADDVERVLAEVDLTDHGDAVVRNLSGGQESRVSLAAALLGRPELLILDEPTVGLDPVLRRDLWGLFHQLVGKGVTMLVSSHVMDEATRCQRLLLMREGRILADEPPDSLLQRTGAVDIEAAFLMLVDQDREARTKEVAR